ncbi:hypothetical protein [Petroclostridium sp. X23]|uniref:DUF4870 domain-containing protein n=1 Tax=Petroclostridium sp. X23 TaxID=3045146 RepID=UPI0024ACD167|nr:hypothetical protein [Petroclostridium sp. X23]WHH60928.1 hypothetical protein QKW49_09575 [Petroclostridium sp. X23]
MTEQNNVNKNEEVNITAEKTSTASQMVSDAVPAFDPEDIAKNKTMAGLAYLIFFLPLIVCPQSKFARFHANQGLLLLILGFAGNIVLSMIPIIGWLLMPIFAIFILVLGVMGLINGLNGKVKELPLIGKFKLLQ